MIEAVWPYWHNLIIRIGHRVAGLEASNPGVWKVSGRATYALLRPRWREVGQEDVGRKLHCLFYYQCLARNQELKR